MLRYTYTYHRIIDMESAGHPYHIYRPSVICKCKGVAWIGVGIVIALSMQYCALYIIVHIHAVPIRHDVTNAPVIQHCDNIVIDNIIPHVKQESYFSWATQEMQVHSNFCCTWLFCTLNATWYSVFSCWKVAASRCHVFTSMNQWGWAVLCTLICFLSSGPLTDSINQPNTN
jgi:hypothetical protein